MTTRRRKLICAAAAAAALSVVIIQTASAAVYSENPDPGQTPDHLSRRQMNQAMSDVKVTPGTAHVESPPVRETDLGAQTQTSGDPQPVLEVLKQVKHSKNIPGEPVSAPHRPSAMPRLAACLAVIGLLVLAVVRLLRQCEKQSALMTDRPTDRTSDRDSSTLITHR